MQSDLSVSQVSKVLRIRRSGVVALIRSGQLTGYDASPPGAKRPAWRVEAESLESFKSARTAKPTPTRFSKKTMDVKVFFE